MPRSAGGSTEVDEYSLDFRLSAADVDEFAFTTQGRYVPLAFAGIPGGNDCAEVMFALPKGVCHEANANTQTREKPHVKHEMDSCMVDTTRLTSAGLPKFVLVDFSLSTINIVDHELRRTDTDDPYEWDEDPVSEKFANEWKDLCKMIKCFVTCHKLGGPEVGMETIDEDPDCDEDWFRFLVRLDEYRDWKRGMGGIFWDQAYDHLAQLAHKIRAEMTDEARMRTRGLMSFMDEHLNQMPSDEVILDAFHRKLEEGQQVRQ